MKYFCEKCVYSTNVKQNYDNHLISKRHNEVISNTMKIYTCSSCHKNYKCSLGLSKHKEKCMNNTNSISSCLIETINKQNKLIETMMDKIEQITQKPTKTTNNVVNNITILNVLKDNYKNVITFEEFIKNMTIYYQDIEDIKDKDTCIECLQNIMISQLKEYEMSERPIHCIMDQDENIETFLNNTEWVQEYVKDWEYNTPILDDKILVFISKLACDIDTMNIENDTKCNLKKILKNISKKDKINRIKSGLFYGIHVNKYELNYNLIK
jgi:hypothetical protein